MAFSIALQTPSQTYQPQLLKVLIGSHFNFFQVSGMTQIISPKSHFPTKEASGICVTLQSKSAFLSHAPT
jgi:hypothetical protein